MFWLNNHSGNNTYHWINNERGDSLLQPIPDLHIGNGHISLIPDMTV